MGPVWESKKTVPIYLIDAYRSFSYLRFEISRILSILLIIFCLPASSYFVKVNKQKCTRNLIPFFKQKPIISAYWNSNTISTYDQLLIFAVCFPKSVQRTTCLLKTKSFIKSKANMNGHTYSFYVLESRVGCK